MKLRRLIMNLTGNLKDKVEKAETMEEKKNIIADAGMELTDEELEDVAGGKDGHSHFSVYCDKCQQYIGKHLLDGKARYLQLQHKAETGHSWVFQTMSID